jgi:AsmA family protein
LVQIQDSLVTYRDGRTGATRSFKVDKLQAKTESDHITFNLAALVNKAPLSVAGTVGAPDLLSANAPYPLDVTITSGNSSAAAKGQIAHLATMQGIAIDVSAKGPSLSDLNTLAAAALPPLGPYSFAGRVGEVPGGYKIGNLQLTLGDSALTGDASLAIGPKRPRIVANLAASRVDLKDFGVKPGGGSAAGSGGGASDGRVIPATPLPFAALTLADADINFTAQQMIKAPVTMQNVKLALTLADGRLQVKPFEAGVSGGLLRVGLTVDGSRNPAPVAVDLTESHVEAGSLLQILMGSSVLSGGRVDMKLAVSGSGNSVRAIMAGLNGKLDAAMGPGNINNGFAKLLLADLFNLISIGGSGDSSNLKCVLVGFDISRGLATTRQLVFDTSGATIVGRGTIDLASEGLNLHLVPYATATNLANLAIPMIVGGTMANPHVVPDAQAMAEGTIGAVANAPVSVLNTLGSVAGIGGEEDSASKAAAGCGAGAHAAAKPGAKPAQQGLGNDLLNGVGGAAKGAGDALKGLLP